MSELSSTDDTPTLRETKTKKKLSFPSIPVHNESDESIGNSLRIIHFTKSNNLYILLFMLYYSILIEMKKLRERPIISTNS